MKIHLSLSMNRTVVFFTLLSLLLPFVYAQDEQKYNPTQDGFDNLVNVLIPLLIIAAYNSNMKNLVGNIEFFTFFLLLIIFPPIYNFFVYKSTSKFDYICMVSSITCGPSFISLLMVEKAFKFRSNNRINDINSIVNIF